MATVGSAINASPKNFDVKFNAGSNMLTITPLRPWAAGNISVYLKGLDVPVMINVTSGETDTRTASRRSTADWIYASHARSRHHGPGAPVDKIALHSATLQAFLDGTPPEDAHRLKFRATFLTLLYGKAVMI